MKIAILGGGQLARMLVLEGHRLGISCHVFCHDLKEPAAQVTPHVTLISSKPPYFDANSLSQIKTCDDLTFESEFFDATSLSHELKGLEISIFPSLINLQRLQNRKSQKEILDQFKIPTSKWLPVNSIKEAESALIYFKKMVLKKSFGGYDGNGTFVIQNLRDLSSLSTSLFQKTSSLTSSSLQSNPPFIAEAFVPFKRELAITLARTKSGQMEVFPLVQTFQKNNRCNWVQGPVTHLKLNSLIKKIKQMLSSIEYVGTMSFELFDTGDDLIVNETAPRVHNSAHYSQNALTMSQFGLHLLCATSNSPLPKPSLVCSQFLMLNLIGKKITSNAKAPLPPEGFLHWYGKQNEKPGRKMGHLNFISQKRDPLLLKKGLKIRTKIGY
jgi:5-(carboxyamino)imidazole ribonucleotide synthase